VLLQHPLPVLGERTPPASVLRTRVSSAAPARPRASRSSSGCMGLSGDGRCVKRWLSSAFPASAGSD